jgi:hypothetical protein
MNRLSIWQKHALLEALWIARTQYSADRAPEHYSHMYTADQLRAEEVVLS